MSRHLIVIRSTADRERVAKYVAQAPFGTRVEFKAAKRTLPQNDRFYAMLTDISKQAFHNGRKYTPDIWKVLMMQASGKQMEWVTSLDGVDPIPLGYHSSDLSKQEMSDLMEFMASWGAENQIIFHEPEIGSAA